MEIDGVPAGRVIMGLYGGIVPRTAANFVGLCKGESVSKKKMYANAYNDKPIIV